MSLYTCEVTLVIVVDGKNAKKAIQLAKKNIHEELYNISDPPINVIARPIIDVKDLPDKWIDAIPWNEENHEETCFDILILKKFKKIKCGKCGSTNELGFVDDKIICKQCAIKQ